LFDNNFIVRLLYHHTRSVCFNQNFNFYVYFSTYLLYVTAVLVVVCQLVLNEYKRMEWKWTFSKTIDVAPMMVKRYALADGHFCPFRWLDSTDDHAKKRQAAYDFLFTFSINHGSVSLGFRDIDDIFFGLKYICHLFDGRITTLTCRFHLQHLVPISVL